MPSNIIICCRKCQDRQIEPNCHTSCTRYQEQKKKHREVRKKLAGDGARDFWSEIRRNAGSMNWKKAK